MQVNHKFRLYRIKSMPFYSGMCIVCRDEAPTDCKSNLERKSYGSKNSVPDPNASLHIGGENNFIGDTQLLPYASFHVGGENSFTRDTISQPLPYAALHIDDENRLTRDTQPLPNAILNLGGENNFTRDTIIQPLHNAAWHGENSFIRDTITQPPPNATLDIGGENNFTRDAITEPLHNATLHIGGENNFTFIGGENNFIGGAQPPASADNEGGGKNSTRDEGIEMIFTRKTQPQKNSTRDEGGERMFTRKTQPLKSADKEPLLLTAGKNVSSQKKRHQTKTPATLKEPKKARNYNEGVSVALKHMAVAVTSLTNKTKKEDNFSVGNVMKVLQAIPDLDDDLILDACDLLEDEKRARLFLALDANLRKKWLLRKLRS